jgi:hypothetical protein
LKKNGNVKTQENRHLTISELHEHFPDVSRSLIHEIATDWLKRLGGEFFGRRHTKAGTAIWQVP